jgi:hypothetical protein
LIESVEITYHDNKGIQLAEYVELNIKKSKSDFSLSFPFPEKPAPMDILRIKVNDTTNYYTVMYMMVNNNSR